MAQYPTAAATDANLYVAVNSKATTLGGALTSSGGNNGANIEVTDTTGFPSTGFITIDQEAISYTSILSAPPRFSGITRGADGTTATSHSAGATVKHNVIAAHHNAPKDEIIAVETDLVAVQASITPVTAANTATSILNRLAMIVSQIKTIAGLTNWYDSAKTYTNLFKYRRPTLLFSSVTQVNLETGLTGTSGQAAILFPDGDYRTDSNTTHINFVITRNAALSGSAQSGLRTSLSEATNTWYALYAVKVTDSSTDFVVVGDTLLPLQANYSSLNTNFGTNGWVYLGMIRNGDQSGTTGDILAFAQSGDFTMFYNTVSAVDANCRGILLASSASVSSVTYSLSSGTSGAVIPNQVLQVFWTGVYNPGSTGVVTATNSGNNYRILGITNQSTSVGVLATWGPAVHGFRLESPASSNLRILITGFTDSALGIASNPLL